MTRLAVRTAHALRWSYISTAVSAGAQLVVTATLARLLSPRDFGLVAASMLVVRLGQYLSQGGLSAAIVQAPQLDDGDIRFAFAASMGLGLAFAAVGYFSAPAVRFVVDDPLAVTVTQAISVTFLTGSVGVVAAALLRRSLRFRALALAETASFVLGYAVVGVWAASRGAGVWSLVAASVGQSFLIGVLSYALVRHPLGLPLSSRSRRLLLARSGAAFAVAGVVDFVSYNVDNVVVGRAFGASVLGGYTRAISVCSLPGQYLSAALGRVMLPAFATVQGEQPRQERGFLGGLLLSGLLVIPISLGIFVAAEEVVATLLGTKWLPIIPVVRALAVSVPFNLVAGVPSSVLDATGQVARRSALQLAYAAVMLLAVVAAIPLGVVGVAWATTVIQALRFLVVIEVARRRIRVGVAASYATLVPGLVVGVVAVALIALSRCMLVDLPTGAILASEVAAGAVAYLAAVWPFRSLRVHAAPLLREAISASDAGSWPVRFLARLADHWQGKNG
jgi:lipopolysaccharide exporter